MPHLDPLPQKKPCQGLPQQGPLPLRQAVVQAVHTRLHHVHSVLGQGAPQQLLDSAQVQQRDLQHQRAQALSPMEPDLHGPA